MPGSVRAKAKWLSYSTIGHIAADDPVHDVVERLLHVSGQWVVAAAVDRDETKRRMLEIVERVIGLLTS